MLAGSSGQRGHRGWWPRDAVSHRWQVYCWHLGRMALEQLPESCSGPSVPQVPAHKSVVLKVLLMYAILVGSFASRAATSTLSSVGSMGCDLCGCGRGERSGAGDRDGDDTNTDTPSPPQSCQGNGEKGTRGLQHTAEGMGMGGGDTGLPAGYLGLGVVVLGRIHFVLIQGIDAAERGGRGLRDGRSTDGVGTRGDSPTELTWPGSWCPRGSPGRGTGPWAGSAWGWPWQRTGGR